MLYERELIVALALEQKSVHNDPRLHGYFVTPVSLHKAIVLIHYTYLLFQYIYPIIPHHNADTIKINHSFLAGNLDVQWQPCLFHIN